LLVKTPPSRGPQTDDTANTMPKDAINRGRRRKGTEYAMMVMLPEVTPAPPRPETARPMIRAVLLGARAHTRDPSSKRKIAAMKVYLIENLA
jgi:hypothetical protein